jgi:hypothetical protein
MLQYDEWLITLLQYLAKGQGFWLAQSILKQRSQSDVVTVAYHNNPEWKTQNRIRCKNYGWAVGLFLAQ